MKRAILLIIMLAAIATGCMKPEDPLRSQAKDAMKKSTDYFRSISTNGGYVGIYSLDLQKRYGEAVYEKAKETEIWVQPPGTPSVGQCFLRAYKITGDDEYLEAARATGRALAWGQRQQGGWNHRVDVSHLRPDSTKPERASGSGTFDDNITQGALAFLMNLDSELDEDWLTESIELGLDFMLESQFENGAWPQWYPLTGGYHDYYTFNDNSINDCIRLMIQAHRIYGKEEYIESARRGGDFIILSRIAAPQTGWAQQYSHDMKPAWARKFEPLAVCTAVTSRNIRTLVDLYLYTKDEKYLKPIPEAIEWLENAKLGENLWARFYELETNTPIYGDRDGTVHYTLEEISEERRSGYSWQGGYGIVSAVKYYNDVIRLGPEGYQKQRSHPFTKKRLSARRLEMAESIKPVIKALDAKGRWVSAEDSLIYSRDFVANFNRLCSYLEMMD